MDAAFEIFSDVALNPSFDEKEITRVRNTRLTQILQQRDNPNTLANKFFFNAVYGGNHPYGYLESGTEESNKSITRDDMMKFWQAGYVPERSALVVAGDITEAELRAMAEKYFAKWAGKGTAAARPNTDATTTRRIVIIDKPGSPQTALRIGHIGVARSSTDYVPIEVMNIGLGGLFSSRINMNLREKNGYTYGAFSTFAYRRGPGPFYAGGSVRTDVTAPAVREIFNELERMRTSPVTADELMTAKDAFARSLPGLFETTPQIAGSIAQIFVYDLPLDYYSALPARINAVTAADIQRVAEKYITPNSMIIVAVGDRSKIEQELTKLNLGAIEVRGADGNPISSR